VSQLDAIRLDDEITEILQSQFMKIFILFKTDFVEKFKPEIEAFLHLLIFRFSIFMSGGTYGNRLQNLIYRDERTKQTISQTQKLLFGLLSIGMKWMWNRLNRISIAGGWADYAETDWQRQTWSLLALLETLYKATYLINLIVFLFNGKYPTLINRLLSIRLVYARPSMIRRVSFEYMNRQLVWHGFTEFLLFLMPLLNFESLKRKFQSKWSTKRQTGKAQVNHLCAICSESAFSPYVSNCEHLFCYYCLKVGCMNDQNFTCPLCGQRVSEIRRYEANLLNT